MNAIDLAARLEGAVSAVEVGGMTISYRHPTQDQVFAALSSAGINPERLDSGKIDASILAEAAKLRRAHEVLGGYCICDVQPRPDLPQGAKFRARDKFQLLSLTDETMIALDPYVTRLGQFLFENSKLSDEEGEG